MLNEKWIFDNVDLNIKDKWGIEEVLEGIGRPKLRGANLQIPFQNGNRWIKKRFDTRKIIFSMWIKGKNRSELDDNIEIFLKTVGRQGQKRLRRITKNGEVREAYAEIFSDIKFVRKSPGYSKFALELILSDPFFYSTNKLHETKVILAAEYLWTHINPGSAPATDMTIKFIGPLSNPTLQNMNNSIWLQYLGDIGSDETVVLNTKDFTCTQGNLNMISAVKHGGDAYWMVLENDINSMRLKSDITGGNVEIEYYPSYY